MSKKALLSNHVKSSRKNTYKSKTTEANIANVVTPIGVGYALFLLYLYLTNSCTDISYYFSNVDISDEDVLYDDYIE